MEESSFIGTCPTCGRLIWNLIDARPCKHGCRDAPAIECVGGPEVDSGRERKDDGHKRGKLRGGTGK
jgi:hypothetical protein